jgi:alkanesulfonate monooxygenase SsuD/methylene tetrahydromethanopterin reductase-like flavin-dependent oxidoreductase (luciferase family)
MIGGSGERKTLRTVARYADQWNAMGSVEKLRHKDEVLRRHCDEVGRDTSQILRTVGCKPVIRDTPEAARRAWAEFMALNRTPMSDVLDDDTFWVGTPEQIAETMVGYRDIGFATFLAEIPAPFDAETLERWIGEVKPMVDAA